ncbi:HAD family hydrolase [Pedococcus sp. KACC 23699]|uniref:HAD family hydrolase n=1 Tax=Pedococcus sp. KACC 23699 TaxID=3149228 RepID=A0AAU7JUB5_9MICO
MRLAIETLQQAGSATCVASSGSHARMTLTLGLIGLRALFEGRIYPAEDVHRGKPAPDLFRLAADRMGRAAVQASSSRTALAGFRQRCPLHCAASGTRA